jgi:hypothetical protein
MQGPILILLRSFRLTKDVHTKVLLKEVDRSIKHFYNEQRKRNVRKVIVPGNAKSLWTAVNAAKDCAKNNIPGKLYQNGVEIDQDKVADEIGLFFDTKIMSALNEIRIVDSVFNGRRLVNPGNKMFMQESDIWECMKSLKQKNSEGIDRIPQKILLDGNCSNLSTCSALCRTSG